MATHCSILAWKISWGHKESDKTEWLNTAQQDASAVSDQLLETLWTIACQAALSMGFSRQEYWSGLPFPFPGYLPNRGIEPVSLMSPAQVSSLPPAPPGKPRICYMASFFFFFKDNRTKIDVFKELQPSFKTTSLQKSNKDQFISRQAHSLKISVQWHCGGQTLG